MNTSAIITGLIISFPTTTFAALAFWLALRKDRQSALDKKVDKSNCDPAMKRIGREIDDLKKANGKQNECIRGVENGMSWLVGRAGGDYKNIKQQNAE